MAKKKPSESPDNKYVGFVKTIGKEKFAVTMCGGKKTWKKFWPKVSPNQFSLEDFFLFKPQLNFKKSFIDHLTASQKNLILEKTNKKLATALRNADILFDIVILPQSNHETVDWWVDYAHSFLTQKYQCKDFNYDQLPYVYVEYRIDKSGKLSPNNKIMIYSKMNKKIQRNYYKPILDKIFKESEIKTITNHHSGFLDAIQLVVRSSDVVQSEDDRKGKGKGCRDKSHIKKYNTRTSPPYPANECKGRSMKGNDGEIYVSKANKNGVYRWVKKN